ncbi:MAG: MTAP family purine nucleoside phosphorylase [Planctomycetota bacterium]
MTDRPIKLGIIGGSGLGEKLGLEAGESIAVDTPFGRPSSDLIRASWEGVEVLLLQRHGPGHVFNPSAVPYRANIFAMKARGVTHLLASGATGSLREHIHPGDLALVDQVIDKTTKRANTFYEHAAVHVEFAEPCCPVMRDWLLNAARSLEGTTVHPSATYVAMEGPAFSTKAESLMHRQWGGDLIGMTMMPEARLAREAEIAYATIAMPTDFDCWKEHTPGQSKQALLQEIIGNLQRATDANIALMKAALRDTSLLQREPSPAHSALELGVWSDKGSIDAAEVDRLGVLWGRYFA